jgi:hypothetical protein
MPIVLENETTSSESLQLCDIVKNLAIPHLLYAIPSAEGWGKKLKRLKEKPRVQLVKHCLWYTLICEAMSNFGRVRDQEHATRVSQTETLVKGGVHISHGGNRRAIDGKKSGTFKSRPPVAFFWLTVCPSILFPELSGHLP